MDLLDATERTSTYHCLWSRFYAAATVSWILRGSCVSLVRNDLCGVRTGWIPADFTLHWSWAHVGPASWATELPSGDGALLQGLHEPQSHSKLPNKTPVAN